MKLQVRILSSRLTEKADAKCVGEYEVPTTERERWPRAHEGTAHGSIQYPRPEAIAVKMVRFSVGETESNPPGQYLGPSRWVYLAGVVAAIV